MNLKQTLLNEFSLLAHKPYVNKDTLRKFLRFVTDEPYLIRDNNRKDHVCCFFLPINLATKSIYLVHHKKAQDWIPPGGHIDTSETPLQTVRREFNEELSFTVSNEDVFLFDITIKDVRSSKNYCETHYDLWYIILCREQTPFVYLKKEFYNASWFCINNAYNKIKLKDYSAIIQKIKNAVFNQK